MPAFLPSGGRHGGWLGSVSGSGWIDPGRRRSSALCCRCCSQPLARPPAVCRRAALAGRCRGAGGRRWRDAEVRWRAALAGRCGLCCPNTARWPAAQPPADIATSSLIRLHYPIVAAETKRSVLLTNRCTEPAAAVPSSPGDPWGRGAAPALVIAGHLAREMLGPSAPRGGGRGGPRPIEETRKESADRSAHAELATRVPCARGRRRRRRCRCCCCWWWWAGVQPAGRARLTASVCSVHRSAACCERRAGLLRLLAPAVSRSSPVGRNSDL